MKLADFQTTVPTRIIEGLNIKYNNKKEQIDFPISTYETALFASINRGAKVSKIHPISVAVFSSCMTRSVLLECKKLEDIIKLTNWLKSKNNKKNNNISQNIIDEWQNIANTTSNHCQLLNVTYKIVGNLMYLRLEFNTDEASGHNITTFAGNEIAKHIIRTAKKQLSLDINYISNSANVCCDKKVSAINSIFGRGKSVQAEIVVSKKTCEEILHTTADKIVNLNIKKNYIGSILSGSVCSANAHFANMLSAMYLPLGQDIANIVEGSQGVTYCEKINNGDLYFSVNLPNIICGCVGNGKSFDFVKENLKMIKCIDKKDNIVNNASERMACVISAVVLCGELSLMSALTNQDELVKAHKKLERI